MRSNPHSASVEREEEKGEHFACLFCSKRCTKLREKMSYRGGRCGLFDVGVIKEIARVKIYDSKGKRDAESQIVNVRIDGFVDVQNRRG